MNKSKSQERVSLAKATGSVSQKLLSRPFLGEQIEYNQKISIEQIIEYKRRANKTVDQSPRIGKRTPRNEFTTELFESIESFLDRQNLFIVSPSPLKKPLQYSKSQALGEELTDDESMSLYNIPTKSVSDSKGPYLNKVSASSLIQRRKKFGTMD